MSASAGSSSARYGISKGRELAPPIHGDPWPDVVTSDDQSNIGIEVVEIVNQRYRRHLESQLARSTLVLACLARTA